eukprot:TRINITY_DN2557_c2_g1_i1.p1 TRINITY_DN2557_c2_g1~~TRINITY_DN2557_c2_g1_i1.p1  ORF type:complete len:280 (+),score=41.57 TRINITY_DN2557_c2_g1_i1:55-840(+)
MKRTLHKLTSPFLKVDGKIAVLSMDRGPVNVLNRKMLTDLTSALDDVASSKDVRGLVLTSTVPKVFCAGLDIFEFHNAKEENLRSYWELVQNLWLKLYLSEFATVAAINGSAPAGGCMLACACDYRVMIDSPKSVIGLNETKLGLVAPFWLAESFNQVLSDRRSAELFLTRGDLISAPTALSHGLVDELSQEPLEAAVAQLNILLSVPDFARYETKKMYRGNLAAELLEKKERDADTLVRVVMQPGVQKALARYVDSLKKK